jgi:ribonuclease HI
MKIIYADGSSLGNPGKAGFGIVFINTEKRLVWEFGGRVEKATNNQMELLGLATALEKIAHLKNCNVEVRLDSEYVIKGTTEWVKGWVKKGWKNSQKKDVVNRELWEQIIAAKKVLEDNGVYLSFKHVYGHTGEKWNERVDEIAKGFAGSKDLKLRSNSEIQDFEMPA